MQYSSCTTLMNDLPPNIREAKSIPILKSYLKNSPFWLIICILCSFDVWFFLHVVVYLCSCFLHCFSFTWFFLSQVGRSRNCSLVFVLYSKATKIKLGVIISQKGPNQVTLDRLYKCFHFEVTGKVSVSVECIVQ